MPLIKSVGAANRQSPPILWKFVALYHRNTKVWMRLCSNSSIMLDRSWLYFMPFSLPADKKIFYKPGTQYVIASITRNKRRIMLKSTQNVSFLWNCYSPSYPDILWLSMMQRRNQALKVATKPLNMLLSYYSQLKVKISRYIQRRLSHDFFKQVQELWCIHRWRRVRDQSQRKLLHIFSQTSLLPFPFPFLAFLPFS